MKKRTPAKPILRHIMGQLVYGNSRARRFTQDSPILPDVWTAFAHAPHEPLDLILTPNRAATAGAVATQLHDHCKVLRKQPRRNLRPDGSRKPRSETRIAHLPGVVAVRLYFDELLRLVLPATTWWDNNVEQKRAKLKDTSPYKEFPIRSKPLQKALTQGLQEFEMLGTIAGGKMNGQFQLPVDVRYTARLAGCVALAFLGYDLPKLENESFVAPPTDPLKPHGDIVEALLELYDPFSITSQPKERAIHHVSLNRNAQGAVSRSTVACKADAARLLFNISCDQIVWAVADSGIESRHPAFHDWRGKDCTSRVIKIYDFQSLREDLSLDLLPETNRQTDKQQQSEIKRLSKMLRDSLRKKNGTDFAETLKREKEKQSTLFMKILDGLVANDDTFDKLDDTLEKKCQAIDRHLEKARKQVDDLTRRLQNGFDVDWGLLEPLVQVDQQRKMDSPTMDHGTHVAGIIGADWPEKDWDEFEETRFYHAPTEKAFNAPGASRSKKAKKEHDQQEDVDQHQIDTTSPRHMIGMCPDIKLIDLRVLRDDGQSDEFEVIAALQLVRFLNTRAGHLAVHGVNLSLSIDHDVANYACGRTPICDECNQLVSDGVVVVAAAGNYGHQRYQLEGAQVRAGYNSISITDPGNADGVITVGATHRYRPHEYGVSYFSSRGPTGDGRRKPDLVAPGEKINAPIGQCEEYHKDGTSMAAPHVSGAAALLMARHSELIGQPRRIKEILCQTATDLGREPYFQGAGMLDILRALQSI